jgi:hypothetical protein
MYSRVVTVKKSNQIRTVDVVTPVAVHTVRSNTLQVTPWDCLFLRSRTQTLSAIEDSVHVIGSNNLNIPSQREHSFHGVCLFVRPECNDSAACMGLFVCETNTLCNLLKQRQRQCYIRQRSPHPMITADRPPTHRRLSIQRDVRAAVSE